MRLLAAILATMLVAAPVGAQQAETLADIRQDLAVLLSEIGDLKSELTATSGNSGTIGGASYDRVIAIEGALQSLTAKTEELEYRIRRVVDDGTNRIGDLEFRVCEIEPGCDIGNLGKTTVLGDSKPQVRPSARPARETPVQQLAVGEEADFRRAQEALAKSDFRSAAEQFATFRETYPGSPLEPEALMGQGNALEGAGDTREAARAYLNAYSGYPNSDVAPGALTKLGVSLGALGKVAEACVTLTEVGGRYPGTPAVAEARQAMAHLGCS